MPRRHRHDRRPRLLLATGADAAGDGVTALNSTLTIKLLSDAPALAPRVGVYSRRLGDRWLAGGASNSGGKALLRFLAAEWMAELTPLLDPDRPTGLDWHPMPEAPGERFPVADQAVAFAPEPAPGDEPRLFQCLLEGIAKIEGRAYALLREFGGPALRSVRTVGGGAANPAWARISRRLLGVVPMPPAANAEAAYGTALLALRECARG